MARAAGYLTAGLALGMVTWASPVLASASPAQPTLPAQLALPAQPALPTLPTQPAPAAQVAAGAHPATAELAAARAVTAAPGRNLLVNAGAEAGAVSAHGWDAVTVPGWQIRRGLPTVVRYGTAGFPRAGLAGRDGRGRQLFAGGAGGTAALVQRVPLRTADGQPPPRGARFTVSGWLGGTRTSWAQLRLQFRSGRGALLGTRRLGPDGPSRQSRHSQHPVLRHWRFSGPLPAGTRTAVVQIVLATSLTNVDGPDAPVTGYDRAVADGARFSVSFPARQPAPLAPPASRVPRFDHVFVFYFENEDYSKIIGNTRQAPYLNSLLPRSSVLADFFAEEHPSDGNYLALAGGSTFGIPLTDPLEENPRYTISAPNIGDRITAAHETWKAYAQNAAGPCDDTVHHDYWDDDLPFLYFRDVRDRPAYCAAHLPPLEALRTDLQRTASTPNLAWVGPDDCTDMEGCGIRAGDTFLRNTLGAILRSPAWTTQRSLAVITFDEDGFDHEHPAQRVATLVLGSRGVRQGYVSRARYTHYSLLATIDGALGLRHLTANDRYAQPMNDIFTPSRATPRTAASLPTAATPPTTAAAPLTATSPTAAATPATATTPASPATPATGGRPALARPRHPTAFVVNAGSGTVTPVDLTTRRAERAIRVGRDPESVAITPDGREAFVANRGSGTVTVIGTAARRALRTIRVGSGPRAIAIAPDGRTVYVANTGSGTVTPVSAVTWRAGPPIAVGAAPLALAVTRDSRTVYAVNWQGGSVTPIDAASRRPGPPIPVGSYPVAIALAPDGRAAYVANYGSDTVTPIETATGRPGPAIPAGQAPGALAVTPNGKTVYVVDGDTDQVTPVSTATGRPGHRIRVGYAPAAVAVSATGRAAYVVNTISGTVTPVRTATGRPGHPISVGVFSYPLAIELGRGGSALVVDTYGGQVTPVNVRTGRHFRRITVGSFPVAAAIAEP